jgi:hypothetical protein
MVTKKAAGKKTRAKLKLKKDTIKDLNVKGKVGNVKGGGRGPRVGTMTCLCATGAC